MTTDDFIRAHAAEPVERLALLAAKQLPRDEAAYALRQIEGRQRLRPKVPSWAACDALRYPARLALEQCSGEAAARYKAGVAARLLSGGRGRLLADLTGGFGVDFFFVSRLFDRAVYVERNAELAAVATHNLPLLGAENVDFIVSDAVGYLREMPTVDLLFLDPARRDAAGRKTVLLSDCEPDAVALLPLLRRKCRFLMLKLSPMLDVERALGELGVVTEVHVFAHRGECKDLLLVADMERAAAGAPTPDEAAVFCVEDDAVFAYRRGDEAAVALGYPARFGSLVGQYLYEPGPSLLKAGAFRLAAERFGLQKLHPNSHLYVSSELVLGFPGRTFRVDRESGFGKRELRAFAAGAGRANLAVRNFPADVATLRKRLGVRDGGPEYWFATTLGTGGEHRLLACTKAVGPAGESGL